MASGCILIRLKGAETSGGVVAEIEARLPILIIDAVFAIIHQNTIIGFTVS
jgi:hypothetical protein